MADFLDTLQRRVLLFDGAMGTQIHARDLDGRGRLLGQGELLRGAQSRPPGRDCGHPPRLSARRRRCRRDQHLRRFADHARRVRAGGAGVRDQPARRRAGARGDRPPRGRRPGALRDRRDRARHPPALARAHRLSHARGRVRGAGGRPDRRRRRRDPVRDLPGSAPGQGRGQRRAPRDARGRAPAAAHGPGHHRDHRHHAGRHRHRRGGDHRRRARRADHRPELRHRAAGDGRARGRSGARLAGADLGAAERRPARAGRRPDPLSAGARDLAAWLERFVVEDGVAVVGGCCGTTPEHIARTRSACCAASPRMASGRGRSRARSRDRRRSPRSIPPCRCARRTLTCRSASAATPTAPRRSASARRPRTGTPASRSAGPRCAKARTRSTSAPPTSGATRSPTCARW